MAVHMPNALQTQICDINCHVVVYVIACAYYLYHRVQWFEFYVSMMTRFVNSFF
jgi:hypothetical protein